MQTSEGSAIPGGIKRTRAWSLQDPIRNLEEKIGF